MPTYHLIPELSPYGRFWPSLGLRLKPGETVTRKENPDPMFLEEVEKPAHRDKTDKAAAAESAPAADPKETD